MALPAISSILFSLVAGYVLYKVLAFVRNYIAAARSGFTVFASPVPQENFLWNIFSVPLQPHLKKWLPGWIYDHVDVSIHGWEFRQKDTLHRRLGKTFIVPTTDGISIWSADVDVADTVLARRKDFLQAPITAKFLNFLGPNVLSANGEDWQRQRRIVAPNLNDRISDPVWTETCKQASTMLDYFTTHPSEIDKTLDGLRTITINVLGHAGYGQNRPWTPEFYSGVPDDAAKGPKDLTYFESIYLITIMLVEAAFLPPALMQWRIMPASLRLLGRNLADMPRKSRAMLESERRAAGEAGGGGGGGEAGGGRSNFLSMLVHMSDHEAAAAPDRKKALALTEDEMLGNLWVFSAAGFDTTANTLGYAVLQLAARPQWQRWIREELRRLDADVGRWPYKHVFPECPRVLAVMLETLRLFTPVLHTTRSIASDQHLRDGNGVVHHLRAPMTVYVSAAVIHVDPAYWGPDPHAFRPSRWISSAADDSAASPTEKLITPAPNTFLPWSGGPRVCPGQKMAQVEFVAALATLFRNASCEAVPRDGETVEQARESLVRLMDDSTNKLTLQIRTPREVRVRWVRD